MSENLSFGDIADVIAELEVEFNQVREVSAGPAGKTNNCTDGSTTINHCCYTK